MTPEQMQVFRWEREIDERNRPLTDDELDAILPKEGYKVRWKNYFILICCVLFKVTRNILMWSCRFAEYIDSCIKCFNTCSQAEADNSKMVVTWFCPFSYTTQIF